MSPQDPQQPQPPQQPYSQEQPYPAERPYIPPQPYIPQAQQPQYPPQQTFPSPQVPYPPVPPPPPLRNNCLIFGIIGVGVLLMCGIIGLVIIGVSGKAVVTAINTAATQVAATSVSAEATHAEVRKPTRTTVAQGAATPARVTPTVAAQEVPTEAQGTPSNTGDTITLAQLSAKRKELTDAQWPEYEKTVIGKTMADKGVVTDVSLEIFGDKPQIEVDVDKATEFIESRDYLVGIPAEGDDLINKGEEVSFSGTIASLDCFFSICTPTLNNSTYEITGNKQPAKTYPTQTEVHYADFEAKRKELTELQWRHYADSVVGAKMTESGYIYDVQKAAFDDTVYDVQISLKALTGELDSYQLLFSIPAAEAPKLNKGQAIDFSGNVKSFELCILTSCTVSLENATYTAK